MTSTPGPTSDERAWLAEQYNRRVRAAADKLRAAADDVERRQVDPDRANPLKTGRCMWSATNVIGIVSNLVPYLAMGDVATTAEEIDQLFVAGEGVAGT